MMRNHLSCQPAWSMCCVSAPCAFLAASSLLAVITDNEPRGSNQRPRYLNMLTCLSYSDPYATGSPPDSGSTVRYAVPLRSIIHFVFSVDNVRLCSCKKACSMSSKARSALLDYANKTISSAKSSAGSIRPKYRTCSLSCAVYTPTSAHFARFPSAKPDFSHHCYNPWCVAPHHLRYTVGLHHTREQ